MPKSGVLPRVLCIGRDTSLLLTRKWVLETRFEVETATSVAEAAALLDEQHFKLVVLCYTLSARDCSLIHDLVQSRSQGTKLLAIASHEYACASTMDQQFPAEEGPAALLREAVALAIGPTPPAGGDQDGGGSQNGARSSDRLAGAARKAPSTDAGKLQIPSHAGRVFRAG